MRIPIYFFVVALVGAIAVGCAEKSSETTQAQPQDQMSSMEAHTTPVQVAGKSLGETVEGEHFSITLSTDPKDPKAGDTKLTARVLHHGDPIADARVLVSLSMPTMNMGGPEVELKHTKDGVYEGTTKLSMGGEWQAKVTVSGEEGHANEATYRFVAMQE